MANGMFLRHANLAGRAQEETTPNQSLSLNFAKFSKKCSKRWKTISAKEKSKFKDMTESDKAHCYREIKNYTSPKVKDRRKISKLQKCLHLLFSCFSLNITQRLKANTLLYPMGIKKKKTG